MRIAVTGSLQLRPGAFASVRRPGKKIIGPSSSSQFKRPLCPPPLLKPLRQDSAVENPYNLPQALTLLLEFLYSLNSGKDLLIVQTVSGLRTFGFCNQTENRIVMNGLTSETRIPHHLANLVELPGNHGNNRCADGVAAKQQADPFTCLRKTLADGRWQNKPFNWSTKPGE